MKNLITCLVVTVLSGATFADTWTVDDDGKADFDNIQDAVNAASNGDEIIVMPGTYTSTASPVVNMLGKAVTLRSLYPNNPDVVATTIIDGEGLRLGILCHSDETNKTIIEGFTITNGYAGYGGGMDCTGSNPALTNCTFTDNTAEWGGGMYNNDSSPTLTDCIFENNTANYGGGMINYYSIPTLTNCTFIGNTANNDGGGMYNNDSSPTLTNCTFIGNTAESFGGGMDNIYNSSPTLTNCTFTINSAYDGGGIWLVGGSITNCTFTNNHATWGGGATCSNATSVTFCTFTDNIGLQLGGGLVCHGDEVVVNECNIRGNQSGQGGGIFTNHVTGPSISYSIVCGNVDSQIIGAYVTLGGNTIADFCPGNLGTCCTNDICLDSEEEDDCIHFGGQWLGKESTCVDDPCPTNCLGDLSGDGQVNVNDLLILIAVWGTCP